ncbi:glycosyltransferase family 10 fucosyltransferase [Nitzschia inconspicua]|uniref:Fucosyltransferase n=2 Tax=Nitzschia inconspicua TaxID=303405 RepID=A0A9K3PQ25_9STRA|nr:glycosyltransferase family 10 fucosyltransferase [Nitzschia inconspicua]
MPLPNTTDKNPFRSRNRLFHSRKRLNHSKNIGRIFGSSRNGGAIRNGYAYTAVQLERIIRFVGTLISLIGIFCILYFKWDWIIIFLNGPQAHKMSSSSTRSIADLAASHRDGYRPPEAPRPPRKDIFHHLNQKQREALDTMKQTFESLKNSNRLVPCRLDNGECTEKDQSSISFFRANVLGGKSTVLLHNPLPEDRFWCGKRIMGDGGTLQIDNFPGDCSTADTLPYVYTSHPPIISNATASSRKIPPVELFWNTDNFYPWDEDGMSAYERDPKSSGNSKESIPCSVPCKSTGSFDILNTINVRNTKWEIILTMEGKQYYSEAHVRAGAYRDNRFYATTSFRSEIPVPYFSWAEYNIQHPPVDFAKAIKGASFLANNCGSQNSREELVQNLTQTALRVDSLSDCLHNAEPPLGVDMANKTDILKEYLFHLAFENQREDDYITEKLWGALASGTLPVYFGAPNVKDHVPPNSIVVVDDFATVEDLANHLVRLANDRRLYESYHAWRYQPIDKNFANKYAFTNTHSTCRMCKFSYATRHGLAWNQSQQEVDDPYISHKSCRNKIGLVGHPFKEYWLAANGQDPVHVVSEEVTKTCKLTSRNRAIDVDHGALRRKVFDRDGVTDLVIDMLQPGSYILKLETPIAASEFVELDENVSWIQDSQSRLTVLVNSGVQATIAGRGTLHIPISSTVHVRIIVENVDHFHKGARKVPSYFGDLMARDFLSPVESYKLQN